MIMLKCILLHIRKRAITLSKPHQPLTDHVTDSQTLGSGRLTWACWARATLSTWRRSGVLLCMSTTMLATLTTTSPCCSSESRGPAAWPHLSSQCAYPRRHRPSLRDTAAGWPAGATAPNRVRPEIWRWNMKYIWKMNTPLICITE